MSHYASRIITTGVMAAEITEKEGKMLEKGKRNRRRRSVSGDDEELSDGPREETKQLSDPCDDDESSYDSAERRRRRPRRSSGSRKVSGRSRAQAVNTDMLEAAKQELTAVMQQHADEAQLRYVTAPSCHICIPKISVFLSSTRS
jgi:hypothetical protein